MQRIFTCSAYETSAADFFELLRSQHPDLVLDVRLKNTNQLCGFTKQKDLEYLIPALTNAVYAHDLRFAPSANLLDKYLKHWIDWDAYRDQYLEQLHDSDALTAYTHNYAKYSCICILGTATRKRRSHSEILVQLLQETLPGGSAT